ncbi:hypothetical protein MZ018_04460 [Shewanella sp. JNE10-2]|uniref:hypothetical protein n=1 Tax=unclassified Shewanella TaxID=196818 RepID=UPI0020062EBC|nr:MULTISPECIES: hypothetical protein [unclassified Shewanella]MCK7630993.1 hypothetical protein [Shewanella sp. JNE9-1]MCK7646246.1 hypothetical protein [Shewanella sp. JNE3-1]MCK7654201.1 hypothetical protein [Shewanella sp. JNE4-1]UPO28050.1 hypothetical protein MZ018_04460 [Shewanella sp. JNE10-2]UPO35257.1 hypothetical protein MZ097_20125 [Shewanella sp. JNE7]
MSSISYLHGWKPELCIQLEIPDKNKADFNRLLVKGFPSTKALQKGVQFEDANRKDIVLQIKARFDELIAEGKSQPSLGVVFNQCSLYLRWCDKYDIEAFTQTSLEGYFDALYKQVLLGDIKRSNYSQKYSHMKVIFSDYLNLPEHYFNFITVTDRSDKESFEAYTRSDLNQLLPFLRSLFKQTYQQFIQDPDKHINAHKTVATMNFNWKKQSYSLCAGISKMMCAGTFLLSYYTYANSSDLFQLKQPANASTSLNETWYIMPAFKRRAFKTIQIEIGAHELEIPKYSMSFFDNLLSASRLISNDANATLLQTVSSKKVVPMRGRTLQSFLLIWLEKHFNFTDQAGRRLRPVVSRFRETGAQITAYHQGEMMNDIMLNNTPNTRKKSYSKGNKIANNGMIQDAMSLRMEEIKQGVSTKEARTNLGIDVLVIEEEYKINLPNLSRTPNGGSCASPFGEKSKKYTKKAIKHSLIAENEKLACADLLACFGCPSQVIVQSLSDIWCLLSFKACIEESLYNHLDASHYRKNFEDIVTFIEVKILPYINKTVLKQAEKKLNDDGGHPLWSEAQSILGLMSSQLQELSQ